VRDRIVIGIADDAARRKLLQLCNLDLATAVDDCRASEIASRQLKVMTSATPSEEVNALKAKATSHKRSKSHQRSERPRKEDTYEQEQTLQVLQFPTRAF